MNENTTPAPITFECTECGVGHYHRVSDVVDVFACCKCEHVVTPRDFDLETGESLTTDAAGRLAYVSATEDDPLAFLEDADVTHGTVEDVRWGYESARRAHGDDYADYLIERDAEYTSKGLRLTPWPLSLAGNDGE